MNLTPVLEAIIGLLAALITGFLIPYLKKKTSTTQQEQLKKWTEIAVAAAEQIYKNTIGGEEKKQYVIEFLSSKGIQIDMNSLDAMIEASVYQIKQGVN